MWRSFLWERNVSSAAWSLKREGGTDERRVETNDDFRAEGV